ncbi:hypothetical protein P7K49_016869 [Saguinus oedipus]|uniref:Uncharacterized protein n=1 Tax=Saguinus oedipus TaxID=9490 RepID=A0ABQ9VE74_SAGOE|nr:hypothetical protein P7K49_016869 [Saguinus oedipus]
MQRRHLLLPPRGTLLRRDLLEARGRFLESQPPLWDVSERQFWPARRDGLGPGPGFAQAAFEAAPAGSSWGLPPFELRWRAGARSPALSRLGAAISMATAVAGHTVARECGGRAGRAVSGRACALGGDGRSQGSVKRARRGCTTWGTDYRVLVTV